MFKIFVAILVVFLFNCKESIVSSVNEELLPSTILDLSNWKITIPFDENGMDGANSGVAKEIKLNSIAAYTLKDYYFVNSTKNGVVFRAHAAGAHTSGSGYPRCEYREMTNGKEAKWQSNIGKHTLEIDQAITFLPIQKKHVVAGQIHSTGDFDDVITCRLEDKKLFLSHNGKAGKVITTNYVLGTRFKIKWEVENNEIKSFFNDQLVETYPLAFPDSYFKAGCYTQSASWGKNNNHQADPKEYGEVVIYSLKVKHE